MIPIKYFKKLKGTFPRLYHLSFNERSHLRVLWNTLFWELNVEPKIKAEVFEPDELDQYLESTNKNLALFIFDSCNKEVYWESFLEKIKHYPIENRPIVLFLDQKKSPVKIFKLAREYVDGAIVGPVSYQRLLQSVNKCLDHYKRDRKFLHFIQKAQSCLDKKEFDQCRIYIEKSIMESPNRSLSQCLYGELYLSLKDYKKALKHFLYALDFNPKHYRSLKGVFNLFYETGHFEQAYRSIKKILYLYPIANEDLANGFRLLIQINKFDEINFLLSVYEVMPIESERLHQYCASALTVCARYYINIKDFDQSIEAAQRLGELPIEVGNYIESLCQKLETEGFMEYTNKYKEILEK